MLDTIGGAVEALEGIIEDMEEEGDVDHKRAMHMAALQAVIECLNKIESDLYKEGINM